MSRLSTLATSTLMPALNVLSTTLPDITFFSLVRTNAGPLPGLTCWNSTTFHSCPSRFSVMPFFRSLVLATGRLHALQDEQFAVRRKQGRRRLCHRSLRHRSQCPGPAVCRYDQHVLDADAPLAGQVHTRLDGDRNPIIKFTRSFVSERRGLMDLKAYPVPQPMLEVVTVPSRHDQVAGGRVHVGDVRPDGQR